MAIKDIKFMNGECYLLKDLSISLEQYEDQMQRIEYERIYEPYRCHKDEKGVENTKFPSIIIAFYDIIFSQGVIPSPEHLIDAYYKLYEQELHIEKESVIFQGRSFRKMDLDARILRTYPSLVRDHHFFLMLTAEHCFDRVIYSCKKDIKGKDLIVQHNGKEYFISLFANTGRSTFFKKIKNTFRHIYTKKEIQMPLDFDPAKKCGDFFVYGQEDIHYVKAAILKKFK